MIFIFAISETYHCFLLPNECFPSKAISYRISNSSGPQTARQFQFLAVSNEMQVALLFVPVSAGLSIGLQSTTSKQLKNLNDFPCKSDNMFLLNMNIIWLSPIYLLQFIAYCTCITCHYVLLCMFLYGFYKGTATRANGCHS